MHRTWRRDILISTDAGPKQPARFHCMLLAHRLEAPSLLSRTQSLPVRHSTSGRTSPQPTGCAPVINCDDLGDVILLYSECGGCCTVLCTFSWLILIGKDRTGYPATAGAYAADMEGSEMSPVDVDHDALASGTVLFVNVYFYELG